MTPRGDDTSAPKSQATFASPDVRVIPFLEELDDKTKTLDKSGRLKRAL